MCNAWRTESKRYHPIYRFDCAGYRRKGDVEKIRAALIYWRISNLFPPLIIESLGGRIVKSGYPRSRGPWKKCRVQILIVPLPPSFIPRKVSVNDRSESTRRRLEKPGPVALRFNRSRLTRETPARVPPFVLFAFEHAILAYVPNPWY